MSDQIVYDSGDGEHVAAWLGPYHDGEVSPALREQIEAHLAACPVCRRELDELRQLSVLLQAGPAPLSLRSDAEFARAVVERVSRPALPLWQRGLKAAWQYAPLLLFAVWAFFQAVQLVSGALLLGLRLVPGGQALLPGGGAAGDGFLLDLLRMRLAGGLTGQTIEGLVWLGPLDPLSLLNLIVLAVLAVLFLSWLASWWAYHAAQAADQE